MSARVRASLSRAGWRGALIPIVALLIAGAALVVLGEPSPVQRNSGVSVPVRSDAPTGPSPVPDLLLLESGGLSTTGPRGLDRLPDGAIPGAVGPIASLRQVSATMSAAMVEFADGVHAVLLDGSGFAADLGRADLVVPGADPAAAAVQLGSTVTRYTALGEPIGSPFALPPGMSLAADSAQGAIASTVVGPLPIVAAGAVDPAAQARAALTYSALQTGELWTPIGAVQPLAARGPVALVWNPLLRVLGLLDLRLLTAVAPVAPDALPLPAPAPGQTEPSQIEPTDPAQADPAQTDPAQAEPAQTEPVPPDPAQTEPTDPAEAGPAGDAPAGDATPDPIDPTASLAPQVARSLLPVAFPSLPGIDLTGPATFSPDGTRVSVAGQVGLRPRLAVGRVPAELVRGTTTLAAMEVIGLGGELPAGAQQPTPVWSGSSLIAARPDGTIAIYSLESGVAVGHDPRATGEPDAPLASEPPGGGPSAGGPAASGSASDSADPSADAEPSPPAIAGLGPA